MSPMLLLLLTACPKTSQEPESTEWSAQVLADMDPTVAACVLPRVTITKVSGLNPPRARGSIARRGKATTSAPSARSARARCCNNSPRAPIAVRPVPMKWTA